MYTNETNTSGVSLWILIQPDRVDTRASAAHTRLKGTGIIPGSHQAAGRSHLWILYRVPCNVFPKKDDNVPFAQLSSAPYPATLILARPSSVLPATTLSCPMSVFTATPWSVNPQDVAARTSDGWGKNPFVEVWDFVFLNSWNKKNL